MTDTLPVKKVLLVTGLSGAGKTTALKTLEDLGWEAVDNFPIRLAGPLLALPTPEGRGDTEIPLALGFDTRTRGFNTDRLIDQIKQLQKRPDLEIMMLFLDCAGSEIERRYSETRRRHPLAQDRPAIDGIAQERALMTPLRQWADLVIDTSKLSTSDLQGEIREKFRMPTGKMTVSVTSFGFSRGVPHNADLIFDMRFLKNPHWDPVLRPMTGLDAPVADYVSKDPEYAGAVERIKDLLLYLLPRYDAQGKAYVTISYPNNLARFYAMQAMRRQYHTGTCIHAPLTRWNSKAIRAIRFTMTKRKSLKNKAKAGLLSA
jgi:RNase adapter protein RapZ